MSADINMAADAVQSLLEAALVPVQRTDTGHLWVGAEKLVQAAFYAPEHVTVSFPLDPHDNRPDEQIVISTPYTYAGLTRLLIALYVQAVNDL